MQMAQPACAVHGSPPPLLPDAAPDAAAELLDADANAELDDAPDVLEDEELDDAVDDDDDVDGLEVLLLEDEPLEPQATATVNTHSDAPMARR